MTIVGSTFLAFACARIKGAKVSVATTTAVTPRRFNSILSWKLHDEHEPQSPSASRATLYFEPISSSIAAGAPWLGLGLKR